MVDYSTASLIDSVERRAGFPTKQGLYTDADFVLFMNEAMFQTIVPEIVRVREEFFLSEATYDIVAGQANYAIPVNAIGQKVRSIELYDPTDVTGTNFRIMPRVNLEDIGAYEGSDLFQTVYYMNGNNITLYPTPQSVPNSRLRIRYFRRPSELVEPLEGSTIATIDYGTGVVSVDSVPSGWNTSTNLDVTRGIAPFNLVQESVTPTNISGFDITLPLDVVAELVVGDTLAETGYSIVPQISMVEAHHLLEEACTMNVLEGIDDSDGLMRASARYDRYLVNLRTIITPRDDAGVQKIVATNGLYGNSGRNRGNFR